MIISYKNKLVLIFHLILSSIICGQFNWKNITTADGLISNRVYAIFEDSNNNIWFGTWDGGVSKLDIDGNWTSYTKANGLASNWVNAIEEDKSGNIWFGTQDAGISVLKKNGNWVQYNIINTVNMLADNYITGLDVDGNGNVWISTLGGISMFSTGGEWYMFDYKNTLHELPTNSIEDIVVDNQNNKWLASSKGITRLHNEGSYSEGTWKTLTKADGLVDDNFKSVAIDSKGQIWGGSSGGVSVISSSYSIKNIPRDLYNTGGLGTGGFISGIAFDPFGNTWVGGQAGIALIDKDQQITNTSFYYIQEIIVDSKGNIWAGSDGNGIYYLQNPYGGSSEPIIIIDDNFDGDLAAAGWAAISTNPNYTWQQGNLSSFNFSAIDPTNKSSVLCNYSNEDQDEYLFSPLFDLSNGKISMEFYAGYSTQWLTNATMVLYISKQNGLSKISPNSIQGIKEDWTPIWQCVNDGNPWQWRKIELDLTEYAGNNVMLAWNYFGKNGDAVAIDNFKVVETQNTTGVIKSNNDILPSNYTLDQNYPNPFNPSTTIKFSIPNVGTRYAVSLQLKIYDILGREVATLVNQQKVPGNYEVTFDGTKLSSGIYFYTLRAGSFVATKKMLLLK